MRPTTVNTCTKIVDNKTILIDKYFCTFSRFILPIFTVMMSGRLIPLCTIFVQLNHLS